MKHATRLAVVALMLAVSGQSLAEDGQLDKDPSSKGGVWKTALIVAGGAALVSSRRCRGSQAHQQQKGDARRV